MILYPEDILKLLLALALGGMIGAERELRDKAAGLRTLMFICTGSALFTILSGRLATLTGSDPTRITAGIVTGIGFLGAGVIMREHGEIYGLTTAAMIWLVAALGVGVGGGQYLFALLVTAIILLGAWAFPLIEHRINALSQVHTYQITLQASLENYRELCQAFQQHGLHILTSHRAHREGDLLCTLVVNGRPASHDQMIEALFDDPRVKAFEV